MSFDRIFPSLNPEISTSQNDVRGDLLSVDGGRRGSHFHYSTQKSLSDTDINKSSLVSDKHWLVGQLQRYLNCLQTELVPAFKSRIKSFLLYFQLYKGPSLPNLFKKSKDSDQDGSSTGAEEETSFGSEYSGGKRVSGS